MSKTPQLPREKTDEIINKIKESGYDVSNLQYVTHQVQK
jgi:lipocalin